MGGVSEGRHAGPFVLEGLTALPWVQEKRQEQGEFLDCDSCMEHFNHHVRAEMHCGLMPASAHRDGQRWEPSDGTELTTCAGYTTKLPDVVDVAIHFAHWENGALDHVCPGGAPKPLLNGLVRLKTASESRSSFRMRESAAKNRGSGG